MKWLGKEYGLHEQDNVRVALNKFFHFRKGHRDLNQYLADFDMVYDEASASAGLAINELGRAHLLLEAAAFHQNLLTASS